MAKCDLCGDACAANQMTELRPQFRVEGVTDLCPGCAEWARKVKDDALAEVPRVVQSAILERLCAPPPLPWWKH